MLFIALLGEVAQVGKSPRWVLTMYFRFIFRPFCLVRLLSAFQL